MEIKTSVKRGKGKFRAGVPLPNLMVGRIGWKSGGKLVIRTAQSNGRMRF